ncbi:hypothetical protein [Bradyrhizobium monzae]|uniref:hypothetical protein n=1 Tax=Bradyrhizobium sp. Oc8 TaxID=2876780 RepID=UPI001F3C5D12|nr:hypothetical protein [Bradyrhizobium sp. Oc8]
MDRRRFRGERLGLACPAVQRGLEVMAVSSGLLEVELMLRGVIRERKRWLGLGLLANEFALREPRDLT